MQLYYQIIEQLDLAAEQLNRGGASFARFAMILTDNAIELMVHHKAQNIVMWDEINPDIIPPEFNNQTRKQAKGQNLRPKIELCVKNGVLSKDEADWVLICHKYRNTLYHQGVAYESFCYDLGWHYHDIACQLLPRFAGQIWWGSSDKVSDVIKKYSSKNGLRMDDSKSHLSEIAVSLCDARPTECRPLAEALSIASVERLKNTQGSLEFLVNDNPAGLGKQEMIEEIQFTHFIRSLTPPKFLTLEDVREHREAKRAIWTPHFPCNPLPNWSRRGKSISNAKSNISALRRYDRLLGESKWFEKKISEAAMELEIHIDMASGR